MSRRSHPLLFLLAVGTACAAAAHGDVGSLVLATAGALVLGRGLAR